MEKALAISLEVVDALSRRDIYEACRLTDELKVVMDTYKRSC